MLTIIDADSLLYYSSKDTIIESITELESRLTTILTRTGAEGFILCISSSNYYRRDIFPEYKGKRKESTLKYIKTLKNYLLETYKVSIIPTLEADDLVALYKNFAGTKNIETTISSPDKDVLLQIPGKHYNYQKDEFVETSTSEGIDFLFKQVIMGDSTDNIQGIPGKGPVFADKLIKKGELKDNILNTLTAYIDHYGNIPRAIKEFYVNFTMVYILRSNSDITNFIDVSEHLTSSIDLDSITNPYTKTKQEW